MVLQSTLLASLLHGATEHIASYSLYRASAIYHIKAMHTQSPHHTQPAPCRTESGTVVAPSVTINPSRKKDGEEVVRLGQHPTVSDPK